MVPFPGLQDLRLRAPFSVKGERLDLGSCVFGCPESQICRLDSEVLSLESGIVNVKSAT